MSSAELAKKLMDIPKGKSSLTEAIKELELSREAFVHAGNIQEKLLIQEQWISELRDSYSNLVSQSFLAYKFEEFSSLIDKSIKNRVEELSVSVISQLNSKISMNDAENLVNKKVAWTSFNNLSQQVGMLKSRVDKHIYADFEGLKTKLKLEESGNNQKKNNDAGSSEEILALKSRLSIVEQHIQQIFNEEEILDEEYDSQEEMDNMIDDLERAVLKDRKSHEFGESLEVKNEENAEENQGEPKTNIEDIDFSSPNTNKNEENIKETISEPIKPSPSENNALKSKEIIVSLGNKAPSRGTESKSMLRRNSKESSIGSKGASNALIRQITKKIAGLQKEVEDHKAENENFKNEFEKVHELISYNEKIAQEQSERSKEFNERIETMQASFLRAIRRSGAVKEKPQVKEKVIVKSHSKDVENIAKDFEEKFRRIIKIEGDTNKLTNDNHTLKSFLKEKFSDIIGTVVSNTEMIQNFQRELDNTRKNFQSIEEKLNQKINEMRKSIENYSGPLTDLISDQSRENIALKEEVKRNQEIIRNMFEEYSARPDFQKLNLRSIQDLLNKSESEKKGHSRVNSATPTLSVKHRYYKSNKNPDNVSIDENWLSYLPDGKPVWLPRVPKSAGRSERKVYTPEVDVKKL